MKNNKRFVLFLLLCAFSTLVCRCGFDNGEPATLLLADGNSLQCREFYETEMTWSAQWYYYTYDCSIPCPDGSMVSANAMRLPNIEGQYNGSDIVDLDLAALQDKYCAAPAAATEPPTASPTESPTEPPTEGDSMVTSAPFLTGKVTACDYKAGFINFERANAEQEYSRESVQVILNQQPVECGVPNSNLDVLSCDLPRSIRFPLNVQVQVQQIQSNDFNFEGACNYKDPGSAGGNDGGDGGSTDNGGGAPACDPHLDPTCPVDCSNPDNADLCH